MKNDFQNKLSVLVRRNIITEAGKYLVVGGICTLLDFSLLFTFTHYLSLYYLLSSILSFVIATVLNYYLCTLWIFKVRSVENKNLEIMYYVLITAVGLGINFLMIWMLTEFAGFYFMLSKLLATFVTYWWNFGARKYFLHTKVPSKDLA